jgi:long-chain acyl-CoA synthetase
LSTKGTEATRVVLDTLPKNLLARVEQYGDSKVAMRKKEYGIWQEYTWVDTLRHVEAFCLGLLSLGMERGDRICIIGDNDPEYYWAELAVQAGGGTAIGVFTDCIPTEIEYVANHSNAAFVVAHDQEQCDKLLEIRQRVPNVKKVIFWDDRGLWNYHNPWLMSFREVEELGRKHKEIHPELFEELVAQGTEDDIAIFSYTSGTTGLPKGAMIAHRNLLGAIRSFSEIDPFLDTDDYLSFSPLAWITEQALGLTTHVVSGVVVNFPEEPETVRENIREIGPQFLLFGSRLWESLVSQVQVRINDASWINRQLYGFFLPVGYRVADAKLAGREPGFHWKAAYALGEVAVFRTLRDKLGLSRIRSAYTSGAALGPDVVRFFRAIGVNLKNLYGSTEGIVHTIHRDDDIKFASVGKPPPEVEIKIADNGEILIRSPSVFVGYHNDAEETARTLREGWLHTGDAGYVDQDQHLIYLDRVKDMLELASGEWFSPQYIEGRLKFSPYIQDAMAVGGRNNPFVTMIINIDFENVGRWAEKRGLAYTTFVDLSQKPEVYNLVRADVERVNDSLPPAAKVHKFVLLHKEFDPDEAELTRTRKLRRTFMESRYQQMIDAMYNGLDHVVVRAEVKYRDGRMGVVETPVRVCVLDSQTPSAADGTRHSK